MNTRWSSWLFLAFLAAPCAGQEPPRPNTLNSSRAEIAVFLSKLKLEAADRVEALPVSIVGAGLSAEARVEELPVPLDRQQARKVGRALSAAGSFEEGMSACLFEPAVAFRFQGRANTVLALVCFRCSELIFEDGAGRQLSGKLRLGANRSVLMTAAKLAFPKNAELQAVSQ